jgi:hypothetical protein
MSFHLGTCKGFHFFFSPVMFCCPIQCCRSWFLFFFSCFDSCSLLWPWRWKFSWSLGASLQRTADRSYCPCILFWILSSQPWPASPETISVVLHLAHVTCSCFPLQIQSPKVCCSLLVPVPSQEPRSWFSFSSRGSLCLSLLSFSLTLLLILVAGSYCSLILSALRRCSDLCFSLVKMGC